MTGLPDGWDASVQRIAGWCAKTHWGETPLLTLDDRYDAALDGIITHLSSHGWPGGGVKDLFRAGSAAITQAGRESVKHLLNRGYWTVSVPAPPDAIAEFVTDKIGVRQIAWSLPEAEWHAIWALAEVMKRDGGYREAAALLGISEAAIAARLKKARVIARALWVAPGETPRGRYVSNRGPRGSSRKSRYQEWKYRADKRAAA